MKAILLIFVLLTYYFSLVLFEIKICLIFASNMRNFYVNMDV